VPTGWSGGRTKRCSAMWWVPAPPRPISILARWWCGRGRAPSRVSPPLFRWYPRVTPSSVCDLAAIAIQDRVLLGGERDAIYAGRRDGSFLVAVNCTEPGGTCFCASMGTGPRAASGFDIALTEVLEGTDHYFVAESGSEVGSAVLAEIGAPEAKKGQVKKADGLLAAAAGHMGREMETRGLADLLRQSLEHPHWQEVAKRCLTCANCTLVCPTCFCANVEDVTDLAGRQAQRIRRWDSCFNYEFSLIHGGPHRASPAAGGALPGARSA
jgi:sulfhydrogenase subunit beta (sulfur reductase)